MSRITQLQAQIDNLTKLVKSLEGIQADPSAHTDAELKFANLEVIQARATLDGAYNSAWALDCSNGKNVCLSQNYNKWIFELFNYRLATFPLWFKREYWIRVCRWADKWSDKLAPNVELIGSFPILVQKRINACIKTAKLFKRAGIYFDKDKIKVCYIQKYDDDTATISEASNWYTVDNEPDLTKIKFKKVKREEVAILEFTAEYAGDYVMLIKWLGLFIYFETAHINSASLIKIIATIKAIAKETIEQVLNVINDPMSSNADVYGSLGSEKNVDLKQKLEQQTNQFLDRIKFYQVDKPNDFLDACNKIRQDIKETAYIQFGWPTKHAVTQQTLAEDADSTKEEYEWTLHQLIKDTSYFQFELQSLLNNHYNNKVDDTSTDEENKKKTDISGMDKEDSNKVVFEDKDAEAHEQRLMEQNEIGDKVEPQEQNAAKNGSDVNTNKDNNQEGKK